MLNNQINGNHSIRILSIDRLRGFAVFVMVFFQFTENFGSFKILSRLALHSPKPDAIYLLPNFSLGDTNISVFLLAIGLTYGLSFNRRRERYGKKFAIKHFLKRYISIVGIGITLDGINVMLDADFTPYKTVIAILSALTLISILVLIFTYKKSAGKFLKKILSASVIVSGLVGIFVAMLNFILLCIGVTNNSFRCWGTLHHIGLAGLIVLPFFAIDKLNTTSKRMILGFILLFLFGIFHEANLPFDMFPNNMLLLDVVADGGFFAGFAWGAQMLIFSGFADLYYKSRKKYALGVAVFSVPVIAMIAGIILTVPKNTITFAGVYSRFLPINKGSVSPSYIMITTLICLLIFLIFDLFNNVKIKFDFLSWWGKNPLVMYITEFVFVGGLTTIFGNHFETVPAIIGFVECIAIVSVMTFAAYKLSKSNKNYRV